MLSNRMKIVLVRSLWLTIVGIKNSDIGKAEEELAKWWFKDARWKIVNRGLSESVRDKNCHMDTFRLRFNNRLHVKYGTWIEHFWATRKGACCRSRGWLPNFLQNFRSIQSLEFGISVVVSSNEYIYIPCVVRWSSLPKKKYRIGIYRVASVILVQMFVSQRTHLNRIGEANEQTVLYITVDSHYRFLAQWKYVFSLPNEYPCALEIAASSCKWKSNCNQIISDDFETRDYGYENLNFFHCDRTFMDRDHFLPLKLACPISPDHSNFIILQYPKYILLSNNHSRRLHGLRGEALVGAVILLVSRILDKLIKCLLSRFIS